MRSLISSTPSRGIHYRLAPAVPLTRGLAHVLLPTGHRFYSGRSQNAAFPYRLPGGHGSGQGARQYLAEGRIGPWALSSGGTSAMRTHGDDIGEVLALLGVRPDLADRESTRQKNRGDPVGRTGRPRIRRDPAYQWVFPRRFSESGASRRYRSAYRGRTRRAPRSKLRAQALSGRLLPHAADGGALPSAT